MWASSPALTRPLLLDADTDVQSLRASAYQCPTPHLTTFKTTLPIPIHRATSALTRLLSSQGTPPSSAPEPLSGSHDHPTTPTHPHAPTQHALWGLPAAVWRSASRRALLTTATDSSTLATSARSFSSVEAGLPDEDQPTIHDEAAWWQRLQGASTPAAPRLDATTCLIEAAAPVAALRTEARAESPPHTVQLLAELRDAMACLVVVCVGAQVALMWYLATGLLSRNTAGVLLMLLLSSGNAFGFLGGLAFMWCSPTARTQASTMRATVLVATMTWLLAALSCVGALLSLCVGLGLVLVIDANTHLTETYVGGWTVAAYLVLPPPIVAACSLGCALKLTRLLHSGV